MLDLFGEILKISVINIRYLYDTIISGYIRITIGVVFSYPPSERLSDLLIKLKDLFNDIRVVSGLGDEKDLSFLVKASVLETLKYKGLVVDLLKFLIIK